MKKIIILTFISIACTVQGMDNQQIFTQTPLTIDIKYFISQNPCFFIADKSGITAEYMYWDNQECKTLLVQKNLLVEKDLLSIEQELSTMNKKLSIKRKSQEYKKELEKDKKRLQKTLFLIHAPYENKNILSPYFFENQIRSPYSFKKKNETIEQDIEEIKACINSKQELILAKSPKVNENK